LWTIPKVVLLADVGGGEVDRSCSKHTPRGNAGGGASRLFAVALYPDHAVGRNG
jgi:hypothetical protein